MFCTFLYLMTVCICAPDWFTPHNENNWIQGRKFYTQEMLPDVIFHSVAASYFALLPEGCTMFTDRCVTVVIAVKWKQLALCCIVQDMITAKINSQRANFHLHFLQLRCFKKMKAIPRLMLKVCLLIPRMENLFVTAAFR